MSNPESDRSVRVRSYIEEEICNSQGHKYQIHSREDLPGRYDLICTACGNGVYIVCEEKKEVS